MVDPPDGFCKDPAHLEHFEFVASGKMLALRNRICDDDFVQMGGVDAIDGIAGKYSMRDKSEDVLRARALEELGRAGDGV